MFTNLFSVPVAFATVLSQPFFGVDPFEQVVRAYDPGVDMNAELLVRRHFPDTRVDWQYKMKSSTRDGGSVFMEFLHPTSIQGTKIIVNEKDIRQYVPVKNIIYYEPSPYQYEPSSTQRLNYLKLNYSAKYEGDARVAGRMSYVVTLTPDSKELYSRRLWIDQNALFLLRQDYWESGDEGGGGTLFQVLTFKELPTAEAFSFSNRGARLDNSRSPLLAKDSAKVAGFVGFTPPSGVVWPYGLREQVRQVMFAETEYRPLRIRCTDGVSSISVWAWRTSGRGGVPTLSISGTKVEPLARRGSVGVYVEGDMPLGARQKIAVAVARGIR